MRHAVFLIAVVSMMSAGSATNDEDGYVSLFNGRNLDGWQLRRADRRGYVVEGGLLVCPEVGGGYLFM